MDVAAPLTLHEDLLGRLRDQFVEGGLPDGARITERALCEQFRVSRTPLREALKVLAAEGLVELLPNRGARLRAPDPAELDALFDLIGGLEALAGRLACERISDDAVGRIEELHHAMYAAYLRRDLHAYFARNDAIHRAILDAAGNAPLSRAWHALAGLMRRVRYGANLDRERWSDAMREHEAILDALRQRAGEELSDVLFRHLRNKRRALHR